MGEIEEQRLQRILVFVERHLLLGRLEAGDLLLDVAALPLQLRQARIGGAVGARRRRRRGAARLPAEVQAGGERPRATIVIENGVLREQAVARLVETLDLAARVGEGLEDGDALVLVRVRLVGREGLDEVARELRLVALHAALRGRHDRASPRAQRLREITACARGVHEHDLLRGQPPQEGSEIGRRHVGPGKAESGLPGLEAAVADEEDEDEVAGAGGLGDGPQ